MAIDLQALADAFLAISPTPNTLQDALPTLNAQTVSGTVDVPVQAIAAYLGSSMKLASFLSWASSPPSGSSPASVASAAELAFAFGHPTLVPSFAMSNAEIAAQMQGALESLVSPGSGVTGPITSTDQSEILGLSVKTNPLWPEPIQVAHLQMAQRAGLIASGILAWPGQTVA